MSTSCFTTFTPPSGTGGPEVVGWPPTRSGCDAPEISGTSVRHREPGLANNETGYGSICKPPPESRPSGGGRRAGTSVRRPRPRGRGGGERVEKTLRAGGGDLGRRAPAATGGGFPRGLRRR